MNTNVKIGIAIAIVTALIALIILDQSTTPGDQPTTESPPTSTGVERESLTPPVETTALNPATQEPDQEWNLYEDARRAFETRFNEVLPLPVFEPFKGPGTIDDGKIIPPTPLQGPWNHR